MFASLPGRSPARLTVLAAAVATAALIGAAGSVFFGKNAGAQAMVLPFSYEAEPQHAIEAPVAVHDPASYRRPAPPASGRPRIAIIVRGLAMSERTTERAIALSPDITLALSPYGRAVQDDADAARAAGHEIFLDLPVEPEGYPGNDAGPQAIVSGRDAAANAERLTWNLKRFTGYCGVVLAASPALETPETMAPLIADPAAVGLVWAHGRQPALDEARIEQTPIDLTLDAAANAHDIDAALERLEAMAVRNGSAVALASAYPVTLERLARWSATLETRGIELVPASALALAPAS